MKRRSQISHSFCEAPGDAVVSEVKGAFTDYLRTQGLAPFTINLYQRHMLDIEQRLRARGLRLSALTDRESGQAILRRCMRKYSHETVRHYRSALDRWLNFTGRDGRWDRSVPWQQWIDGFTHFLRAHRGVAASTIADAEQLVRGYLLWQFGNRAAVWRDVRIADVWSFSFDYAQGVKQHTANTRLRHLREFLLFVQLKGACSPELPHSVPHFAAYAQTQRPAVLSCHQRRQLLASFARRTPEGSRNYCMALCMIDLGLRATEVARLRCIDIQWRRRVLGVPATKTGRGRELPLTEPLLSALRRYVRQDRPQSSSEEVFLRHSQRRGQPVTRSIVKLSMRSAYRRCGFPATWGGTHRLRHTFASRLYKRGATLKQIADVLGHRQLDTTNVYTQTDLTALRRLAQPWPLQ